MFRAFLLPRFFCAFKLALLPQEAAINLTNIKAVAADMPRNSVAKPIRLINSGSEWGGEDAQGEFKDRRYSSDEIDPAGDGWSRLPRLIVSF
jgi:hypothetical protein